MAEEDLKRIAKIKKSMRISHNGLDDTIGDDINVCLLDMKRVGICIPPEPDSLIEKCIELYCKSQANYENAADRYMAAYEKLRDGISLCGDY